MSFLQGISNLHIVSSEKHSDLEQRTNSSVKNKALTIIAQDPKVPQSWLEVQKLSGDQIKLQNQNQEIKTKRQRAQYDHNLLHKILKVFAQTAPEKTCIYQPGMKWSALEGGSGNSWRLPSLYIKCPC